MDPVSIGMLAMGGLSMLHNMDQEQRGRKLASDTQRYKPWTGEHAQPIPDANPWGDLAQTGAGVMGYQQNKESAALRKQLVEAQVRNLDRGGSPWGMLRGNGSTDLYGNGAFSNVG